MFSSLHLPSGVPYKREHCVRVSPASATRDDEPTSRPARSSVKPDNQRQPILQVAKTSGEACTTFSGGSKSRRLESTSTPCLGRSPYDFVLLNQRIVKLAKKSMEVIRDSGKHSVAANRVVEDMLCEYEDLANFPESLSHVNISTLLHRTAQVVTAMSAADVLAHRHPKLLEKLIDGVYTWHEMFEPRHTATAIWSFGKLGRQILLVSGAVASFPVAFSCLIEKAQAQTHMLSAKEIASVLNGVASLELKLSTCQPLIKSMLQVAETKLAAFGPREIATCTWALGVVGYGFRGEWDLMDKLVTIFHKKLAARKVGNPELASFVWGLAKLQYRMDCSRKPFEFYAMVADEMVERLPSMSSVSLSNVVWSFGKLRFLLPGKYLRSVAIHVAKHIACYEPRHVVKVMHALAVFGISFDFLAAKAIEYLSARKVLFGPQELCNLAWALAMVDELDLETFKLVTNVIKTSPNFSFKDLGDAELRQLHDCMVSVRCFCDTRGHEEPLPPEWEEAFVEAYHRGQEEKKVYSTALSVLQALQKNGSFCQCHHFSNSLSKILDIATDPIGIQVVVEVSLPSHYFINARNQLRGQRLWAMRVMEAQGYVVLRVDSREWSKLTPKERIHFVRRT